MYVGSRRWGVVGGASWEAVVGCGAARSMLDSRLSLKARVPSPTPCAAPARWSLCRWSLCLQSRTRFPFSNWFFRSFGRPYCAQPTLTMAVARGATSLYCVLLVLALASQARATCNVTLSRNTGGAGCPSTRFGCGPSSASPHAMYVKRGCCGYFECDGFSVKCCSTSHTDTKYCTCGPPPVPRAGTTFYVEKGAKAGGTGTKSNPFADLQSCIDVASYTTTKSACVLGPGTFTSTGNGTTVVGHSVAPVDIIGAGVGQTILEGARPLPSDLEVSLRYM